MKQRLLPLFFLLCWAGVTSYAQETKTMDIYGHVMTDVGYNFNQGHPDWFDVMRPTKLPSFENQYGTDGNVYFSVRQTRFGVKNYFQTGLGELKTQFEFEMFGTGVDAGQTTFRLRHAYAELGKFGVGQYWSPFMDIDVFPNSLEYWGPNAMVFFRNIQVRYMPIQGDSRLTIALERPGASADQGIYADRIELDGVSGRFPVPDLSAEYRKAFGEGNYVEIAGIVRSIQWEDLNNDQFDLSGDALGWGLNFSTNLKIGTSSTIRAQVVYGEGIQNYMNDAPVDIGIERNPNNASAPVKGVALPILGALVFLDHNWNEKFSTSLGYSYMDIDNSDAQTADAFHIGHYGLVNLLYTPAKNCLTGVELQYGKRENFSDGFTSDGLKLQFSFKYNFSQSFFARSGN
jgi:hypothetical protein